MNLSFEYLNDYCIVDAKDVPNHLSKGFVPWGSAVYDPINHCLRQVLVKYGIPLLPDSPLLSPIEQDCLFCLLQDSSLQQIADDLCCTVSYVEKLLRRMKQKFNVRSTRMLVKKVVKNHLKPR